jgi:hypothetical protein
MLIKTKEGQTLKLNEVLTENKMTKKETVGPQITEQYRQGKGNLRYLSYLVVNANTTGDPLEAVIFDAAEGYKEANAYSVPSGLVVTSKTHLDGFLKNTLKQGAKLRCTAIKIELLKPTDDFSQFSNALEPFTHAPSIKRSRPLEEILPNLFTSPSDNIETVKVIPVDFLIDMGFALSMLVNLDTKINVTFEVQEVM